jgi:hypothetical protein
MTITDAVNGCFELLGGVLLWMSVQRLWREREVKGVYWPATAFFGMWGWWNLLYYPSLGQWCSFVGGLVVVTANTTWVVLFLWFRRAADRKET